MAGNSFGRWKKITKFPLIKWLLKVDKYTIATCILVALGGATILPASQQKVNLMGDFTLCPFVPMSTTILWVGAVVPIMLKDWKREQEEERKEQERQEQLKRQQPRYR